MSTSQQRHESQLQNSIFLHVDSSIRSICMQNADVEIPWAGTAGVGLVKKNDINFLSRADKRSSRSALEYSASVASATTASAFSGMDDESHGHAADAWKKWEDESADLDALDLEELSNETMLAQAVEMQKAAATQAQKLEHKLVGHAPASVMPVPTPEIPALPASTGMTAEESRATDELITMLQEQATIPTVEEDFERRMKALRDEPTSSVEARPRAPAARDVPTPAGSSKAQAQSSKQYNSHTQGGCVSEDDQVQNLLAQLQDRLESAPNDLDDTDLDEFEKEQVQVLVERAELGDFDEVPSVDLDEKIRRQWSKQWQSSDSSKDDPEAETAQKQSDEGSSKTGSAASEPGSENEASEHSTTDRTKLELALLSPIEWTQAEEQRPEVQEAREIGNKLSFCLKSATDDSRRQRWLAAIAIRSADCGLQALQSGKTIKLARYWAQHCLLASNDVQLQPGDQFKVEQLVRKMHEVLYAKAAAARTSSKRAGNRKGSECAAGEVSQFPKVPGSEE